jgi:hypothetical protein
MFHGKVMLTMLLGACALLVSVAFAAPISDNQAATTAGSAIRTTLQADLTLKSTLSPELFSTTALHPKTCRCSCGFPCNQDDDCGPGGQCEQFISCCDRNQTSQSFQMSPARSTHKGEVPAVVVNVKCN